MKIEKLQLSHSHHIYKFINDPRIKENPFSFNTQGQLDQYIIERPNRRKQNGSYEFSITQLSTPIGICSYKRNNLYPHIAEISYLVNPDWWGKSVATKAVILMIKHATRSGFVRLELRTTKQNIASQKVAEKSGFTYEGVLSNAYCLNNQYHDVLLYSHVIKRNL